VGFKNVAATEQITPSAFTRQGDADGIFLDFEGVVHHEFLPQGRTVNKEYYLEVMQRLCEPGKKT